VFAAATTKTLGGKSRARKKFLKLDVIAVMLLFQDLSRGENFKLDKKFDQSLAAHVLSDKDIAVAGRVTSGPTIARYYESWRTKIIDEVGIHLDPKRLFDDAQKKEIYLRDAGRCAICKELVVADEAEYDHFPLPYTLGGRTAIENGRLVHATCHPRGPVDEPEDA
jgi:hypothetical protein